MPSTLTLKHLVHQPSQPGEGRPPLLVLLHGYGSNEQDLFSLASYLDPRLLIISVRAPNPLGGGMFAWFPLDWSGASVSFEPQDVISAREQIAVFVEEAIERYGADPTKVLLGGFSQGAIMSAAVSFWRPELFVGVVLMSGSASPALVPPDADRAALAGKPYFVCHGQFDQVLPVANGRLTRDLLAELAADLEYREYPMAHEVSAQSLADLASWIEARLAS